MEVSACVKRFTRTHTSQLGTENSCQLASVCKMFDPSGCTRHGSLVHFLLLLSAQLLQLELAAVQCGLEVVHWEDGRMDSVRGSIVA